MAIQIRTEMPGPKSRAWMERRNEAVARGPFHVSPLFIDKAEGAILTDVDGNRLLDFSSGIGVMNVGHGASEITRASRNQWDRYAHLSFNVTPYEEYVLLCERLNAITPGAFAKKSFLVNSGAEAVENAIKIARAHTKRQGVICFEHAFHGRTYLGMSLTGKANPYKIGFAPFAPEIYRAPFPDPYRWRGGDSLVSEQCFEAFLAIAKYQIGVQNVAAVIIEPVLGEGGFLPVPTEFFRNLREFCTENGVVLIADEIQSGFGRTGKFFACEHLDVIPDLITVAKGLGGGLPISAVTGRADMMDSPVVGSIGTTFGGNPICCRAALATIELLQEEVLANAVRLGEQLHARMLAWKQKYAFIGDVRGLGPMIGVEFVKDTQSKEPDADRVRSLIRYAYENGVIAMSAGTFGNVLRFLPPLCMNAEELDEGLEILERGLEKSPL